MAFNVDNGEVKQKPKSKPLQFKRGTKHAFMRVNPILLEGQPAFDEF